MRSRRWLITWLLCISHLLFEKSESINDDPPPSNRSIQFVKMVKDWYDDFQNLSIGSDSEWEAFQRRIDTFEDFLDSMREFATNANSYDPKACDEEQDIMGDKISWRHSIDGTMYYSYPLCLNAKKGYVLRECADGAFAKPESKCNSLQRPEEYNLCPKGLTAVDIGGTRLCYQLLPKQPFSDSKCPYNYNLFDSQDKSIFVWAAGISAKTSIWLDIHRYNFNGGVGRYVNYELTAHYGETVDVPTPEAKGDCVALINGRLVVQDCSALHGRVCLYNPRLDWQYCKWDSLICINSGLDTSDLKCICPVAKAECLKSAELSDPNQNIGIFSKEECALSTAKLDDEGIMWTRSGRRMNETFWSYMELQRETGPNLAWKGFGWVRTQRTQFDCEICEVDYKYQLPTLYLSPGKYDLQITGENSIYKRWGSHDVYCFADRNGGKKISSTIHEFSHKILQQPGSYWCEGFEVKHFQKVTSNVLNVSNSAIYTFEVDAMAGDGSTQNIWEYCEMFATNMIKRIKSIVQPDTYELQWLNLLNISGNSGIYLFRLVDEKSPYAYSPEKYREWKKRFEGSGLDLLGFYDQFFCDEMRTSTSNGTVQVWPATKAGEATAASSVCVDRNGNQLTLKCRGDFYFGARFETPDDCFDLSELPDDSKSEVTDELNELQDSDKPPVEVIENVRNLTSNNASIFKPVDVYLVANILKKSDTKVNASSIVEVVNNLLQVPESALKESQIEHNATDKILSTLDQSIREYAFTGQYDLLETENIISFLFDPCLSMYSGAAYKNNGEITPIERDMTLEEFAQIGDVRVGALVRIEESLCQNRSSENGSSSITFIVLSGLFNTEADQTASPMVASVLLSNVVSRYRIFVAIRNDRSGATLDACAYWKYGYNIKGVWQPDGKTIRSLGTHAICEYNHTTHYGQLITTELPLDETAESLLNSVTLAECSLSMLGIAGIFATAYLWKEWRAQWDIQIMLHYSLVLIVQMGFLFLADAVRDVSDGLCIVAGAVLHFSVLSQLVWTMLISVSYYRKFVIIFYSGDIGMWRCMFFAYVLPTLVVSTVAFLAPTTYLRGEMKMCYPSETIHLATVLLPIGIALLCNLYVFVRIWIGLCASSIRSTNLTNTNVELKRYMRLFVFLFFMLGLTWTFAIFAHLLRSLFCLYVFAFSVSIQGCFMFVYFVLCNREVVGMYKRRLQAFYFEKF